jgi:citrate lyase subunit beta/citryl-CoA lyase
MKKIQVGTENKNDCLIKITPGKKLAIHLDSKTGPMFEETIKNLTKKTLKQYKIKKIQLHIQEKGALDYVIKSRLQAALETATGTQIIQDPIKRKNTPKNKARRTRLYVPGNNPRMITPAGIYNSDCIIFDLEDSVPLHQKNAARYLVKNALRDLDFKDSELWVRINKNHIEKDLIQILQGTPHGICIPKVETPEDIQTVEKIIQKFTDKIKLMPIIETSQGILNAPQIAKASKNIVALAFGAEDLTRDLGGKRSWETLIYPRGALVLAAKASNIQALDTIYPDTQDEQGLREETKKIRAMGFDGKGVIHPDQIPPIHESFTPSTEEIKNARAIIKALQEAKKKGVGVASLEGKMIDEPVEKKARKILSLVK